MGVAALLGLVALAATPSVPWSLAGVLLVSGVAGWWEPRLFRLGVVAAWTAGIGGAGWGLLLPALVLGAARWTRFGTGVVALAMLIAARQVVVSRELAAATEVVPELVVTLVLTACAWSAASPRPPAWAPWVESPRIAAGALLLGAALVGARTVTLLGVDAEARLRPAARLQAVPLVYPGLLAHADGIAGVARTRLLAALVLAAPDRDEAAERLPRETALGLGWRPLRADGDPVGVAMALEARGRGGEALRLLGRHRREGAVDWYRALLERTQGLPVAWGGGLAPGIPTLDRPLPLDLQWETNQYAAVSVHLRRPAARLVLTGAGSPYEGDPVVIVRVDADAERPWALSGPGRLEIPGPFAPGPHRIALRFANDRVGTGGDRNVTIDGLAAE